MKCSVCRKNTDKYMHEQKQIYKESVSIMNEKLYEGVERPENWGRSLSDCGVSL